jgi:hypothetical protein
MNISQLINILSEMDGDADVALFIDRLEDGEVTSELVQLELDDVVIGGSYIGFQVSPEFTGGLDNDN